MRGNGIWVRDNGTGLLAGLDFQRTGKGAMNAIRILIVEDEAIVAEDLAGKIRRHHERD